METYIIVKITSKKGEEPSGPQFRNRMGRVRKALHAAYEDIPGIDGADIVNGAGYMSAQDAKAVPKIFERSMAQAKKDALFMEELGFIPFRKL